jgi:hypothetical protein
MNKIRHLSVREICLEYGDDKVYRQTLYNHFRLGNLPFVKQRSHYFVREPDFLEWLKKFKAGEFVYRPQPIKWIDPEETNE